MNKTTSAGQIDIISYNEFVSLLPIIKVDKSPYPYNSCINYGVPYFSEGVPSEESNYKRLDAIPHTKLRHSAVYVALLHLANRKYVWKKPALELLEDAVFDSLEQFGDPTVAVCLGNRQWLIANPEDFALIEHNGHYDLACYYLNRTTILEVSKFTEKEALEIAKKNQEKLKNQE